MNTVMHRCQTEDDYWRIRPFLREVFQLNGRRELSWHVARMDYWRWPGIEGWGDGSLEKDVFLWETPDGRLAAVLNREGPGEAFFQVHPDLWTVDLEAGMLEAAEEHLSVPGPDGRRKLIVWADSRDQMRQALLKGRGYVVNGWPECQHRRDLSAPVPDRPLADGYTLRPLGEVDELPARAWFSWKAFHPKEPEENYARLGWEWYHQIQRCPLYRRDLDLLAIAPNGDIASFTTVWYDDVTRSAYFEPVGTHPDHLRRGLAKSVMVEGLHRLQRLGATVAFVGGYSPEANALYASVMGPEHDLSEPWVREW